MEKLLQEAISRYNLGNTKIEFIRHNENATYKIVDGQSEYVLRIHKHREGLNFDILGDDTYSFSALNSEMIILREMKENTNITLQSPCLNNNGNYVTVLCDGTPVTMLTWIKGNTLEDIEITNDILISIGKMLGEFHNFSKTWAQSLKLDRKTYDVNMLNRIRKYIKNGISSRFISEKQYDVIDSTLTEIALRMKELDKIPNSKGIIHSDLSKSNLLIQDKRIIPIDFCLCGFGYYYLDFGALFSHFQDFNQQEQIIMGYKMVTGEEVDRRYIEAFEIYQVMLFLAANTENKPNLGWFPEKFFVS